MSFTPFNAPIQRKPPPGRAEASDEDIVIRNIEDAFHDAPAALIARLKGLGGEDPVLASDLSSYVFSLRKTLTSNALPQQSIAQGLAIPQSKKRKLEDGGAVNGSSDTQGWANQSRTADHIVGDVSFSIPQRKKLKLEWLSGAQGGARALGADGGVEFGCGWGDVDQILCLPVPEKTKRQHNFIIIPSSLTTEPIVWTVFEPSTKELDAGANEEPASTANLLDKELKSFSKKVVFPDEDEFASAIVQSHRKEEKAFHVKAHRGAKDGYLFFLSPGILWGFKKPLLFLPFSAITSISYTSVLQRTFNLNIQATADAESAEDEIEFSMLDQLDFAGIDAYIKRHGLNDASLASVRRAKKYGVNDAKVKKETNGAPTTAAEIEGIEQDDDEQETELQKAERELQDAEDEEEEDYVNEDGDDDGSEDSGSGEEGYDEDGNSGEGFEEEGEFAGEEGGYEDEG
ncbi:Rtt106-domain-containing protein [Venturia nashicola]|nr:Rtt106-domain-containing protein [Venturia nashicola]